MGNESGRSVPWRRLLAESIAVVLSILLAFAIDAWWDARQQAARHEDLLHDLLSEFEASRPSLELRLQLARRMAAGTGQFIQILQVGESTDVVSVPDAVILATLGGPTYEPAMNTLDAAVVSGEIERIRNDELRAELATWRRLLLDTREDEVEVRRITNEQIVPLLSRSVNLGPYFADVLTWSEDRSRLPGEFDSHESREAGRGFASVATSNELASVLALRKFFVDFSASDLEALLACLDRTVALIHRQLTGERPA